MVKIKKFVLIILCIIPLMFTSCESEVPSVNPSQVVEKDPDTYRGRTYRYNDYTFKVDSITHDLYQLSYLSQGSEQNIMFTFVGTYDELVEVSNKNIADYYFDTCNFPKDATVIVKRRIDKAHNLIHYDEIDVEYNFDGYFTDDTYKTLKVVKYVDDSTPISYFTFTRT